MAPGARLICSGPCRPTVASLQRPMQPPAPPNPVHAPGVRRCAVRRLLSYRLTKRTAKSKDLLMTVIFSLWDGLQWVWRLVTNQPRASPQPKAPAALATAAGETLPLLLSCNKPRARWSIQQPPGPYFLSASGLSHAYGGQLLWQGPWGARLRAGGRRLGLTCTALSPTVSVLHLCRSPGDSTLLRTSSTCH